MNSGVYEIPTTNQRNIITLFDFLKQDALYAQGAELLIEPSSDVRLQLPESIVMTDREQIRAALCTVARQAVSTHKETINLREKPRIRCPAAQVPHDYPATKHLFDQVAVDFPHFAFGLKQ